MRFRVGVDIGGTFTDYAILDEATGALRTLKVLSTPDRPGQEVLDGIGMMSQRYGIKPSEISYFTHGTTVGVNTVIQRKGAKLALFTTVGFEDVLEVARLKMPDPYDLFSRRAQPLAPRELVWGVAERILSDGTTEMPLDEAAAQEAIAAAKAAGAETIVVAFLHAYANPAHERRLRELVAASAPGMPVTLSSDVWPVIREYERTVTATVAGYVQERVADYLTFLQQALKDAHVAPEPMITKSNGGVMRAELGKSAPIQMLLSGTASGVIGAARIAADAGVKNVLSFDVGGTSADVAIILDGKPAFAVGERVGEFPIYIPTVAVTSIGAGGGSIATVDDFGSLKVGPESAGAVPGPACYARGGVRATITDAYAVCGLLGEGGVLGYGAVNLDVAKARAAIAPLAEKLELSLEDAAEAIIKVSISGMFLEISKLFSRQGADPRAFSLLPFGGAGPMTACLLARDLGLQQIVVPPTPGVLAAYGGLIADIRGDFIRTAFVDVDTIGVAALHAHAGALETTCNTWLRDEQRYEGEAQIVWTADMRYRGQSYEIEVPLQRSWIDAGDLASIAGTFHREHERIYEHADPEAPVQVVNLRAVIQAPTPQPKSVQFTPRVRAAEATARTRVYFDGAWHEAGIYDRSKLAAGDHFRGPAIVRQDDCTTCLVGGYRAEADSRGNLIVSKE